MDGTNVNKVFVTIAEKIIKNLQEDRTPSSIVIDKNSKEKKKCSC